MELYVMNTSLETIGVIDAFTSVIWTKRYLSAGDFELYLQVTPEILSMLAIGNYIYRLDDDSVMIIEKHMIETDAENGNYLTVSGRSLESILTRRIVKSQTTYSGNAEQLIYKLLNENAIEGGTEETPLYEKYWRRITNLILGTSQGYANTIKKQFTGTSLYDAIVDICTQFQWGWKITLNSNRQFVFSLYKGTDHSYNQSTNPFIVFSPAFDNLLNSKYEKDTSNFANIALVAGEGEGTDRVRVWTDNALELRDLNRYEIFVDARDLSKTQDDTTLSDAEYLDILQERGISKVSEQTIVEAFDGECETTMTYVYREDWNIGDVVQIENEFGITASPRILEVTESEGTDGNTLVPTFATWGR